MRAPNNINSQLLAWSIILYHYHVDFCLFLFSFIFHFWHFWNFFHGFENNFHFFHFHSFHIVYYFHIFFSVLIFLQIFIKAWIENENFQFACFQIYMHACSLSCDWKKHICWHWIYCMFVRDFFKAFLHDEENLFIYIYLSSWLL